MKKANKKKDILERVKEFPSITLGDDFLEELHKKIDAYEAERKKEIDTEIVKGKDFKELVLEFLGIFRKPYLAPAIGILVVILIGFYLIINYIQTPSEKKKLNVVHMEETVVPPDAKTLQDSSLFMKENQKEKLPEEKNKSLITKKKKVELSPKQVEPEKILPEEKVIDKKFALTNKPSVKSRDTIREKVIAKAVAIETIKGIETNSPDKKLNAIDKNFLEKLSKGVNSLK